VQRMLLAHLHVSDVPESNTSIIKPKDSYRLNKKDDQAPVVLQAGIGVALFATLSRVVNKSSDTVNELMPERLRDGALWMIDQFPYQMERDPDSGDFRKEPSLLGLRLGHNLLRRYVGAPESRALAWDDLALYLDRWGWRISDRMYDESHRLQKTADTLPPWRDNPAVIMETPNMKVMIPGGLLIDRQDGGHLMIKPKTDFSDRSSLPPEQALEYLFMSRAAARAFVEVMNESGIQVERLNHMDMANWRLLTDKSPRFHEHIFGRARGSRFQVHGEFNRIPPKGSSHYLTLQPLSPTEIDKLRERMPRYLEEDLLRAESEGVVTSEFVRATLAGMQTFGPLGTATDATSHKQPAQGRPRFGDIVRLVRRDGVRGLFGLETRQLIQIMTDTRAPRFSVPVRSTLMSLDRASRQLRTIARRGFK